MPTSTRRLTPHLRHFSTLAGTYKTLTKKERNNYRVNLRPMNSADSRPYRLWTYIVAYGALCLVIIFGTILFNPSHWIINIEPNSSTHTLNYIMLACLFLLQAFWVLGTYSATRATVKAKTPQAVRPPRGLKVAFVTTRAPGEPISMVETTLKAMKSVRKVGNNVTVWLLDETHDESLIRICQELNVMYFSRAGIAEWNQPKGKHGAKTKHGNFNGWREYLKIHGYEYDILCGVDTDHVPLPNYLERFLGYFRDKDVAYVVGPQVYGNYKHGIKSLVARWAESQASFFQSTIQRAGNAAGVPMFVGTNYAVRLKVLDQIDGFQACITEDMATGLAIHTKRNHETGNKWRSVYTPDVLAIGEGPDQWGPYFTQQWRWAAGTFDTWKRVVWKRVFKLSPKAIIHYFLILTFYPITALTWLLGIISSLIYLTTGATALIAPWNQFVSLYLMTIVLQLSLYFWNRRFNVSPHEPAGSFGMAGIAITSIAAPIYLSALIGVAINRKVKFVVTVKGQSATKESWRVFRIHAQWAVLLCAALVYGWMNDNVHPAMLVWVLMQLLICLLPMVLYTSMRLKELKKVISRNLRESKRRGLSNA